MNSTLGIALSTVIDAMAEGVLLADDQGKILHANERLEQIFGYESGSLVGQAVEALVPAPNRTRHADTRQAYLSSPTKRIMSEVGGLHGLHQDGHEIPIEISLAPLDFDGKRCVIASVMDVTRRQRAEQAVREARDAAEEATRLKSAFLANMSHEIRTPMNAIIGMAELCLATALNERQQNYLGKIKSASEALLGIINDILDLSKIEAGKIKLESIPFVLEAVFDQVSSVTALRAEAQGVELGYDINDDSLLLLGDPLRLGQVLVNLVTNALKFSVGGNVVIKVARESIGEKDVELHFSVSDEGIGMTPEQLANLFQPFSQADISTTRKYGGTGLGLTISRNLVELMGGRIWVESTPGMGSTFHFTVRLGIAGPDRRTGLAQFAHKLAAQAHRPVLIVDDNPVTLKLLVRLAEQLGLPVLTAQDSDTALARVQEHRSNHWLACLVDWRMPGIDGLETIRRLRAHFASAASGMPAMILVTAYSSHEELSEASSVVDAVLAKPVSHRHLYVELARSLGVFEPLPNEQERRRGTARLIDWSRFAGLDIVLVEDMPVNQEVMTELLAGVGLQARVATNGGEALTEVAVKRPDLVLMDCRMPVMDGFEASRRLRQDPAYRDLPIIALTANATQEEQEECFAAGMNAHVAKPIRMEALFERILECFPDSKPQPGIAELAELVKLAAATKPLESVSLPIFPGIDVAVGLLHVGGRVPTLLKVLNLFRNNLGRHFVERFTQALAANNRTEAKYLTHSLKGVAATIGATDLSDSAKQLEMAIAMDDADRCKDLFALVSAQLSAVVDGLKDI